MEQASALTYALMQSGFSNRGRKGSDHRTFLSALVYLGKTGCWWKNLPSGFGNFKSIHSRFTDWSKRGVFDRFFEAVCNVDDPSVLRFIDTSFVKCSICALTGSCSENERVVGKTKGGFTTKVGAICDSKMRVHACRIDPGNDSDHQVARRIKLPSKGNSVIGDKGFSSSDFRRRIEKSGNRHCIAQKRNERTREPLNKGHYKKRHKVENLFAKMGRWTRLELRRERLPYNFRSFVMLWAIGTWVKY